MSKRASSATAGFSILEGMVSLAVAGGFFLMLLQLVQTTEKSARGGQTTGDFSDLAFMLSHAVYDRVSCPAVFAGAAVNGNSDISLNLPIAGGSGHMQIQDGATVGFAQVEQMTLKSAGGAFVNTFPSYTVPVGSQPLVMYLDLSIKAKKLSTLRGPAGLPATRSVRDRFPVAAPEISRKFTFGAEVNRDASGNLQVINCLDPAQRACLSLGGAWDPATGHCDIQNLCPDGKIFLGLASSAAGASIACATFADQSCDPASAPLITSFDVLDAPGTSTSPAGQGMGKINCGTTAYQCNNNPMPTVKTPRRTTLTPS